MLSKFHQPVKRFRAIEDNRRVTWTGRGDVLSVKIAVIANHFSFLHVDPEQDPRGRLYNPLSVDFQSHPFCIV
jgi:hypothetical protein